MSFLISRVLAGTALCVNALTAHAAYEHIATVDGRFELARSNTPVVGTVGYVDENSGTFAGYAYGYRTVMEFANDPVPWVKVSSTAWNGQVGSSAYSRIGWAEMEYTFNVNAQPYTAVPVTFEGLFSLQRDGINDAGGSANFSVYDSNYYSGAGFMAQMLSGIDPVLSPSSSTPGRQSINVDWQGTQSNRTGSFDGSVSVFTDASGLGVGVVSLRVAMGVNTFSGMSTATAYLDPRVAIDPTWLALNPNATLTLTPGLGNQIAAVPEPGTMFTVVAGLAALGLATRRRRQASPA